MWIAVVGGLVGLAAGVWLGLGLGDDHGVEPYQVVFTALGGAMAVGGLVAALSTIAAQIRMMSSINGPTAGLDRSDKRAVQKAVLSGVPITPAESEFARRTADQARVLAATLPLATAQFVLLFCGITGSQLVTLGSGDAWGSWFRVALIVVIVIAGVVSTVLLRRSTRRVHRYLAGLEQAAA
jgi:Flp pilus assembly protein TadB